MLAKTNCYYFIKFMTIIERRYRTLRCIRACEHRIYLRPTPARLGFAGKRGGCSPPPLEGDRAVTSRPDSGGGREGGKVGVSGRIGLRLWEMAITDREVSSGGEHDDRGAEWREGPTWP